MAEQEPAQPSDQPDFWLIEMEMIWEAETTVVSWQARRERFSRMLSWLGDAALVVGRGFVPGGANLDRHLLNSVTFNDETLPRE